MLNVNAQVENIGFVAQGIVQPTMHQYHHLGDAVTITDGLVYDPSLQPYVVAGVRSGTRDDRFAFTSNGNNPAGQMSTIAALAAAARVLKPYNPELAERSLRNAVKLWNENYKAADPAKNANAGGWGNPVDGRIQAAIQLWRTTGEKKYRDFFEPLVLAQLTPQEPRQNAPRRMGGHAAARGVEVPMADLGGQMFVGGFIRPADLTTALSLYDEMDAKFKAAVRKAVPAYVESLKAQVNNNPYGVPVGGRFWGGNEQVISWAYNNYLVWKHFPNLVDPELVLAGLNFLYGCHPYSNVSFVTSVGVNVKKVAYGNNRADYTVIPGGIVPGLLVLAPDYFENKDDYPFHWGENECCTRTVPSFVSLSLACEEIAATLNK